MKARHDRVDDGSVSEATCLGMSDCGQGLMKAAGVLGLDAATFAIDGPLARATSLLADTTDLVLPVDGSLLGVALSLLLNAAILFRLQ